MALQSLLAFQGTISGNAGVIRLRVYHTMLIDANAGGQSLRSKKSALAKMFIVVKELSRVILHHTCGDTRAKGGNIPS